MNDADGSSPVGRLEVVSGCMFSGKTARLIERLEQARADGRSVCAFKHALDRRYDTCRLATHDGRRFDAVAVSSGADIIEQSAAYAVVGIDEAHFFGRALVETCTSLRRRGQRVIVAGLPFDAWGQPFPPLPELQELAERVEVLRVPCTKCGQPACYSQRVVPVTNPDMVGGPGEYEPRCPACFEPLPPPAPVY
ncbi:MAG: thymidine kinase [Phycisphaerae bacterium]|jgi:thymidine kinase